MFYSICTGVMCWWMSLPQPSPQQPTVQMRLCDFINANKDIWPEGCSKEAVWVATKHCAGDKPWSGPWVMLMIPSVEAPAVEQVVDIK